ncbi:MAG: hypothetical protein A2992_07600 [Elusimicrobia bacterium RIFCSPLOWO2_01_FULL_59_12]|nr:MAG: hypothetical protein A2992_07600 [Elusimicrobia bacterium RIFCSPLOWO2_01_FULL_59_12]
MFKRLIRGLALFLTVCLIADPAAAQAFRALGSQAPAPLAAPAYADQIACQAFVLPVALTRPSLSPATTIRAFKAFAAWLRIWLRKVFRLSSTLPEADVPVNPSLLPEGPPPTHALPTLTAIASVSPASPPAAPAAKPAPAPSRPLPKLDRSFGVKVKLPKLAQLRLEWNKIRFEIYATQEEARRARTTFIKTRLEPIETAVAERKLWRKFVRDVKGYRVVPVAIGTGFTLAPKAKAAASFKRPAVSRSRRWVVDVSAAEARWQAVRLPHQPYASRAKADNAKLQFIAELRAARKKSRLGDSKAWSAFYQRIKSSQAVRAREIEGRKGQGFFLKERPVTPPRTPELVLTAPEEKDFQLPEAEPPVRAPHQTLDTASRSLPFLPEQEQFWKEFDFLIEQLNNIRARMAVQHSVFNDKLSEALKRFRSYLSPSEIARAEAAMKQALDRHAALLPKSEAAKMSAAGSSPVIPMARPFTPKPAAPAKPAAPVMDAAALAALASKAGELARDIQKDTGPAMLEKWVAYQSRFNALGLPRPYNNEVSLLVQALGTYKVSALEAAKIPGAPIMQYVFASLSLLMQIQPAAYAPDQQAAWTAAWHALINKEIEDKIPTLNSPAVLETAFSPKPVLPYPMGKIHRDIHTALQVVPILARLRRSINPETAPWADIQAWETELSRLEALVETIHPAWPGVKISLQKSIEEVRDRIAAPSVEHVEAVAGPLFKTPVDAHGTVASAILIAGAVVRKLFVVVVMGGATAVWARILSHLLRPAALEAAGQGRLALDSSPNPDLAGWALGLGFLTLGMVVSFAGAQSLRFIRRKAFNSSERGSIHAVMLSYITLAVVLMLASVLLPTLSATWKFIAGLQFPAVPDTLAFDGSAEMFAVGSSFVILVLLTAGFWVSRASRGDSTTTLHVQPALPAPAYEITRAGAPAEASISPDISAPWPLSFVLPALAFVGRRFRSRTWDRAEVRRKADAGKAAARPPERIGHHRTQEGKGATPAEELRNPVLVRASLPGQWTPEISKANLKLQRARLNPSGPSFRDGAARRARYLKESLKPRPPDARETLSVLPPLLALGGAALMDLWRKPVAAITAEVDPVQMVGRMIGSFLGLGGLGMAVALGIGFVFAAIIYLSMRMDTMSRAPFPRAVSYASALGGGLLALGLTSILWGPIPSRPPPAKHGTKTAVTVAQAENTQAADLQPAAAPVSQKESTAPQPLPAPAAEQPPARPPAPAPSAQEEAPQLEQPNSLLGSRVIPAGPALRAARSGRAYQLKNVDITTADFLVVHALRDKNGPVPHMFFKLTPGGYLSPSRGAGPNAYTLNLKDLKARGATSVTLSVEVLSGPPNDLKVFVQPYQIPGTTGADFKRPLHPWRAALANFLRGGPQAGFSILPTFSQVARLLLGPAGAFLIMPLGYFFTSLTRKRNPARFLRAALAAA